MAKVHQHVPAFVNDGEGGHRSEVSNSAELLALPWVKSWERSSVSIAAGATEPTIRPFYRWSRSADCLVAEYDNGHHWWVVAFTDPNILSDLPQWNPPRSAISQPIA